MSSKSSKKHFKIVHKRGRDWEMLTEYGSKKSLEAHVKQLEKYGAEYLMIKRSGTRWQVAIPKEEWNRIDKKYQDLNKKSSRRKKLDYKM